MEIESLLDEIVRAKYYARPIASCSVVLAKWALNHLLHCLQPLVVIGVQGNLCRFSEHSCYGPNREVKQVPLSVPLMTLPLSPQMGRKRYNLCPGFPDLS